MWQYMNMDENISIDKLENVGKEHSDIVRKYLICSKSNVYLDLFDEVGQGTILE